MKNPIKKGTWYYEIQILMFVIMWQHDISKKIESRPDSPSIRWGRLYIWYDSAWRFHGWIGEFRFFLYSLTKTVELYNTPKAKIKVIWINLKHIVKHWALEFAIVDSILSLRNYIRLHKAGFRITNSKDDYAACEVYRFWWETEMIKDMADIDCVDGKFYTMFNGHSQPLGQKPKFPSRNKLFTN